jgi:hypothetical protein
MDLTRWKPVAVLASLFLSFSAATTAQTYVQSKAAAVAASGNNAATFSAQPVASNTVVAGVVCFGPSNCTITSVTDNFSNTYTKIGPTASYGGPTQNVTNVALYCASGVSTGANFTVTAALSNSGGGDSNLYIAEYSGTTCNVDQSASGSLTDGTGTTLLQTSSATTTNASDLLVVAAGSTSGGAVTAGSGYHLRQNGNNPSGAEDGGFEDETVATTGSYSGSMSLASSTTYWAMVMVALKASTGAAPTVTSFTPTSGPVGTSVTITGTNFTGATAVKFNGTAATTFTVNSSTQITATVPSAATSGTISVTTPSGTGTSSGSFTVTTSGGAITYIQSQTAALGTGGNNAATFSTQPTAGDTVVVGLVCYGPSNCTISSVTDNFNNVYTKIGPTASYGGPTNITNTALYCASGIASGANFKVTAAQSNSGGDSNLYIAEYSGLSCNVDQSTSGSLTDGTATTLLQTPSTATTTNAADLLVAAAGASSGGAPTAGTGFHLRQNGNNGVAEDGGFEDETVTTTGAYNASMTLATGTSYWAMVMVALKGSGSGQNAPVITSLSSTSLSAYESVTINGSNFGTSGSVTFNGLGALTQFGSWSSTQIIVNVPFGISAGNVVVTVNGTPSSGFPYTVSPGPSVQNPSPYYATVGTPVSILGAGFGTSQGSVSFNGVLAATTSWSNTSITAVVPMSATAGNVTVTVNGITSGSLVNNYKSPTWFSPGPLITSVSPSVGPTGTVVTITGVRLTIVGSNPQLLGTVTFNGTLAASDGYGEPMTGATTWTDTQIILPVPTGATTGNVVVFVPVQGTGNTGSNQPEANSNGLLYTVGAAPPNISSLSALGGPGGSSLTISGTFGSVQGTVLFQNTDIGGNTSASITTWAANSIVVQVPPTLPIGLFNVQVVNSAGSSNTESFWITGAGCPATW